MKRGTYNFLIAIKESLSEYGFCNWFLKCRTKNIVPEEIKTWKNWFHLKRYLKDGHIYKEIDYRKGKLKSKSFNNVWGLMEEAGIYL
jgi:hypothetical protein